ncbi:hypothetical protein DFP97_102155 [Paenibacillus prosopidis]|uniref:Uncharacterized protein n=1 Tax=Paenibacillus prosopidis TaxID=630520 RepID=A0A368W5D0_9BACL|nr:hypothetical protein DFP97_102155 [Paenibacillus prosopidis]
MSAQFVFYASYTQIANVMSTSANHDLRIAVPLCNSYFHLIASRAHTLVAGLFKHRFLHYPIKLTNCKSHVNFIYYTYFILLLNYSRDSVIARN